MATFIIGYGLIFLVVAFIVFSILVKKRILFGNTIAMQRIFANPLLHYSIKRVLSSLISIALAMLVTFFLIRLAKPADETCIQYFFDPKTASDPAIFQMKCDSWKKSMGMSGSILEQLGTFFFSVIVIVINKSIRTTIRLIIQILYNCRPIRKLVSSELYPFSVKAIRAMFRPVIN